MHLSYIRNGKEYAIDQVADPAPALDLMGETLGIPAASVEYLLHYGLKQSLQDSAAQPASEAKAEGEDVAEAIDVAMSKRLAAIIAGTVAVRGGGVQVRDPFESMVRRLTRSKLVEYAKSKGKKLPKDKAKLAEVLSKFYKANKDSIDNAATLAIAAESAIEIDSDEFTL
jgi:hypothetical protein